MSSVVIRTRPDRRSTLVGNSARAAIAAVTALKCKLEGDPALKGQLLFCPMTDANFETSSYNEYAEGYLITKNTMKWFWDNHVPDLAQRRGSLPKGALDTLVKHFAAILGPRGIRVNGVAPGVIETDMSSFTETEAGGDLALSMQALKRIGQPSDVADVTAFLASNGARWITGAIIPVDGWFKVMRSIYSSSWTARCTTKVRIASTTSSITSAVVRRFNIAIRAISLS